MGGGDKGFVNINDNNFLDRQLDVYGIPSGDAISGWLLLDYPEGAADPDSGSVPELRAIITNHDERTVHAITGAPITLDVGSIVTRDDAKDVRDLKIIPHCGSGLTW
jgi:hypothetical protein